MPEEEELSITEVFKTSGMWMLLYHWLKTSGESSDLGSLALAYRMPGTAIFGKISVLKGIAMDD